MRLGLTIHLSENTHNHSYLVDIYEYLSDEFRREFPGVGSWDDPMNPSKNRRDLTWDSADCNVGDTKQKLDLSIQKIKDLVSKYNVRFTIVIYERVRSARDPRIMERKEIEVLKF